MTPIRIIVCGFGKVGRAFVRLVALKQADLQQRYGIAPRIQAVVDIGGAAVGDTEGLPLDRLQVLAEQGRPIETMTPFDRPGATGAEILRTTAADVLVEATPTNLTDGEPARAHMNAALELGMDILAANKGPLVLFYNDLQERTRSAGGRLFMSAATAAALPTLDVGNLCTAGARIQAVEGILNGTTNYILTRMGREGITYETALKAAQELGIAETDPTLDVEGLDTRNKIILIANQLFDQRLGIVDVDTVGITGVGRKAMEHARADGKVIKLIGSARWEENRLCVRVAPEALDASHPLAGVHFSEKGISFDTDTMGRITVTGGHSSPTGAAAALLKDLIHARCLDPSAIRTREESKLRSASLKG
jgi:homoserine dehydrogenase